MKLLLIILAAYLLLINLDAYLLMPSMIPEAALFLVAILGGSPGIMLGMRVYRHKTLHASFTVGMPLICFFEAALLAAAIILAI